jgi:hypothetical protein
VTASFREKSSWFEDLCNTPRSSVPDAERDHSVSVSAVHTRRVHDDLACWHCGTRTAAQGGPAFQCGEMPGD